jgi:hypothetical protein
MTDKIYAIGKRDLWRFGAHFEKHVAAMTAEGLHRKSDIAAELAFRDAEIERLRQQLEAELKWRRDSSNG